jgi:hypothetical protein
MSDRQIFQLRHFSRGSSIGPIFVAAMFALNARFEIVLNSGSPMTTLVILVLGASSYCGFGAAITGFGFIVMDEDTRKRL